MDEISEKARQIVGEDFVKYMDAKGIPQKCPACQSDELGIMAGGPTEPLQIFEMKIVHPEADAGTVIELYTIVCANCGHIRSFSVNDVVKWKSQESPSE